MRRVALEKHSRTETHRHAASSLRIPLAILLLSSCTVGPDYVRPQLEIPATWEEKSAGTAPADLGSWWDALGDTELDELVQRGVAGNLDLRQAVGRVQEARAFYQVAKSAQFPELDADADAFHERASANGIFPGGEAVNVFDVGVSASWEVDVFGRVRRSVESASANVQASEDDRRAVLVAVIAEVAASYVDIRTLQRRLRVNSANLDSQGKIVDLTKVRFENGIASGLDVAQAESVYAETLAAIPVLELALEQEYNRLSVLLGENPGSVRRELAIVWAIPMPPDNLDAGLPADLVRQRPDIRQAERRLAAETARIGVATADLYPRFVLLGTFGFDATKVADLFQGSSRTYSVGPTMVWNLFDAGRIRGLIHVEEARTAQALAFYEQTVLQGLSEVENALLAFVRLRQERDAVIDAVDAASLSLELATDLYKDGVVDFQNVLDAQRTVLRFQELLAITEGAIVQSVVQLYRALGGGWKIEEPTEQPASTPEQQEENEAPEAS